MRRVSTPERRLNRKAAGFYWREPVTMRFCVIVLHESRIWRGKKYCREFQAPTVRALRAKVRAAGYSLPRNVRGLCESSPRWIYGW